MRRLLPAPILSATLFVVWLLLNNTLEAAHVLLAAVLALLLPHLTERFRPEKPRPRAPLAMLRLLFVVLGDIVVANIEVARRILGPERAIRPQFVRVPLALRDPHAIALLAAIITMTPGTVSADLDEDRTVLLVHAFNVDDEAALVAQIKRRYEAPLQEIFAC